MRTFLFIVIAVLLDHYQVAVPEGWIFGTIIFTSFCLIAAQDAAEIIKGIEE